MSRICCPKCGRRHGNYLTLTYLFIKVLYITNVVAQIFVLNGFIGRGYHLYGFDVLKSVIQDQDWRDSPRFPRVTMCDFLVRRLGNVQRYTVQCVLPINLFNEMIFLFLWFWMVFVALSSCLSLVRWILTLLSESQRKRYVKKYLVMDKGNTEYQQAGEKTVDNFVHNYLMTDGVFILRLCGRNTDAVTVSEFITALWKTYRTDPVANYRGNANREEESTA